MSSRGSASATRQAARLASAGPAVLAAAAHGRCPGPGRRRRARPAGAAAGACSASVETVIDEGDPQETWADIEVWLRRQVVGRGPGQLRPAPGARARSWPTTSAGQFDLEAGDAVTLDLALAPTERAGGGASSPSASTSWRCPVGGSPPCCWRRGPRRFLPMVRCSAWPAAWSEPCWWLRCSCSARASAAKRHPGRAHAAGHLPAPAGQDRRHASTWTRSPSSIGKDTPRRPAADAAPAAGRVPRASGDAAQVDPRRPRGRGAALGGSLRTSGRTGSVSSPSRAASLRLLRDEVSRLRWAARRGAEAHGRTQEPRRAAVTC